MHFACHAANSSTTLRLRAAPGSRGAGHSRGRAPGADRSLEPVGSSGRSRRPSGCDRNPDSPPPAKTESSRVRAEKSCTPTTRRRGQPDPVSRLRSRLEDRARAGRRQCRRRQARSADHAVDPPSRRVPGRGRAAGGGAQPRTRLRWRRRGGDRRPSRRRRRQLHRVRPGRGPHPRARVAAAGPGAAGDGRQEPARRARRRRPRAGSADRSGRRVRAHRAGLHGYQPGHRHPAGARRARRGAGGDRRPHPPGRRARSRHVDGAGGQRLPARVEPTLPGDCARRGRRDHRRHGRAAAPGPGRGHRRHSRAHDRPRGGLRTGRGRARGHRPRWREDARGVDL